MKWTDKIMQKQSEREQIARQAFRNGYNCAQCMMVAFADVIGIDKESALRLSSAFGGGMGRLREVCGSVSGTFMVLGFLYGYDNPADYEAKKELYARVQELARRNKESNGSIVCRELLGIEGKDNSSVPSLRTKEYYKKRPCEELVGRAAKILEDYLREQQLI